MKDKAKMRKQNEKEDFHDKKMNLSLKEYEIEKENDERYINIEKWVNAFLSDKRTRVNFNCVVSGCE